MSESMLKEDKINRDSEWSELNRLFKRRQVALIENFYGIKGPYGYIRHDRTKLGVVVDITSSKLQHRTEKILQNPGYTFTNDGEYLIRLDFSDTNTALALIGLSVNRH